MRFCNTGGFFVGTGGRGFRIPCLTVLAMVGIGRNVGGLLILVPVVRGLGGSWGEGSCDEGREIREADDTLRESV